jgi:sulfoxide reductase heme-binding subunit YedZ
MASQLWNRLFAYTIGIMVGCVIGGFLFFWIGQPIGSTIADGHYSWYISRSTGIVAYLFAWLSMITGLMVTSRQAQLWPGVVHTNDLHRQASVVSLLMSLVHVIILMGNKYLNYTWISLFIPDLNGTYAPIAIGIGQIALPVSIIVTLSAEWRSALGKAWRWIHMGAFGVFVASTIHGIYSGSDTRIPFISGMYIVTTCSVVFLTIYRIRYRDLEQQHRHAT